MPPTASKPVNNTKLTDGNARSVFPRAGAVIDATVSINQGDLVCFESNLLSVPDTEDDCNTFLGISPVTIVLGLLKRPYSTDVDASAAPSEIPGPVAGIVAKHTLKTGATINPGDLIYGAPDVSPQTVAASGTKAIGVYLGAAISNAAAGTQVEWKVGSRYPGDTLVM